MVPEIRIDTGSAFHTGGGMSTLAKIDKFMDSAISAVGVVIVYGLMVAAPYVLLALIAYTLIGGRQ